MSALPRCMILAAGLVGLSAGAFAQDDDWFADNACVQCHRDMPGRSSAIVDLEWKQSVHYAARVTCDACHGGNPAVKRAQYESDDEWKRASHLHRDPEYLFMHEPEGTFVNSVRGRSVSYFCGKCHADIKEKHLGSPHGEFGDPTCLYCHGQGSHAIKDPTLDIIDLRSRAEGGRCSPCHVATTMETVARIKETLAETEERVRTAVAAGEDLHRWGYRSLDLDRLLQDAGQVRSRLRQVFHSFSMLEIDNFAGSITLTTDRMSATHAMIAQLRETQRRQAVTGGLIALSLLAFAGLLVFYRHAYLEPPPTTDGGSG